MKVDTRFRIKIRQHPVRTWTHPCWFPPIIIPCVWRSRVKHFIQGNVWKRRWGLSWRVGSLSRETEGKAWRARNDEVEILRPYAFVLRYSSNRGLGAPFYNATVVYGRGKYGGGRKGEKREFKSTTETKGEWCKKRRGNVL